MFQVLSYPIPHILAKYPQLCKNEAGVFNVIKDEENMVKSAQWFGNQPVRLYMITSTDDVVDNLGPEYGILLINKDIQEGTEYSRMEIKFHLEEIDK